MTENGILFIDTSNAANGTGLESIRNAYAEDLAIESDLLSALSSDGRKNLHRLLMKLLADLEQRSPPA